MVTIVLDVVQNCLELVFLFGKILDTFATVTAYGKKTSDFGDWSQ